MRAGDVGHIGERGEHERQRGRILRGNSVKQKRRGEESGQPGPDAEQLPVVEGVAPDREHAPAVRHTAGSEASSDSPAGRACTTLGVSLRTSTPVIQETSGRQATHRERAAPAGELQRDARDAEADGVAGARAGDEVSHRAAAPRALDVVVDQRERRRVGSALAKAGERVQPEGGPEAIGEEDEGPRTRAGGDAGGDVGALRAVVVGDEADDEERGEIAEVERRLDQARLLAPKAPIALA